MQPPSNTESWTIRYQVPRNVLLRVWWKRSICRPRFFVAPVCFALGASMLVVLEGDKILIGALIAGTLVCLMTPIALYRTLGKSIDSNAQLTDPKELVFSEDRLLVTGPNWKTEVPWTSYAGFSEDAVYFYMHYSRNGFAAVLPKVAFTGEQQDRFRGFAQRLNGR